MKIIILYHGSNKIIRKPIYGIGNPNNDYGLGFYCSDDIELAKEWANKNTENGFLNSYSLNYEGLKVLDLTDKNKYSVLNWLAILMHFRELGKFNKEKYALALEYLERYFIDPCDFDIVIGYRADDSYFAFPLSFLDNQLTLNKLEEVYQLGNLGRQVVAVSKRAIQRMSFLESVEVEPIYKTKYQTRINQANIKFIEIIDKNRYEDGDRMYNLINKNDTKN